MPAVLTAAVAACSHATERAAIDFPMAGSIRGSQSLFAGQRAVVLVGEIHGTVEIPLLTAVLLRTASAERAAVLCVEAPTDEQVRLDEFLASDGGESSVRALLAGRHWTSQDGRAGRGHFGLLELSRRLIADGREITVAAIDIPANRIEQLLAEQPTPPRVLEFARQRDRVMAQNVAAAAERNPHANILVLAGSVHTNLQKGVPWDEEYEPMGSLLHHNKPGLVSLAAETSGGAAWVSTEQGTGPTAISGGDRGEEPFVELSPGAQPDRSGLLYTGPVTAASPMRGNANAAEPGKR
ncbi:ChaN family lipoprotein [Posidoniimonas polymericola]|nr:ChaN family lipoprotein [Posidoniimonas polymericola]